MKTIQVRATINITLKVDEDANVPNIMDELELVLKENTGTADIEDSTWEDYEVVDSH